MEAAGSQPEGNWGCAQAEEVVCSGWSSPGADKLDASTEERGAGTAPPPRDAAGAWALQPPALASSHLPHSGALPPLIPVLAGMHCCLFLVLLRED